MKKKQIIGLVVAAALFVGVSAASVFTNTISKNLLQNSADDIINLGGSYQFNPPSEDYIAIVRVEGTIQEQSGSSTLEASSGYQHDSTMNYIDELMDDSNNKGILLYVDSPGGTVYESEELYQKLKEYKETTKRPIWDYMAHYAASGGYMVSMASDKIYANSNTTTGSIGGEEMQLGCIQCRDGVYWSEKERVIAALNIGGGKSIKLNEKSIGGPFGGASAEAWLCEKCKKIVIEY